MFSSAQTIGRKVDAPRYFSVPLFLFFLAMRLQAPVQRYQLSCTAIGGEKCPSGIVDCKETAVVLPAPHLYSLAKGKKLKIWLVVLTRAVHRGSPGFLLLKFWSRTEKVFEDCSNVEKVMWTLLCLVESISPNWCQ